MVIGLGILASVLAATAAVAAFPAGRRMLAALVVHVAIWMIFAVQHAAPELAAEIVGTIVAGLEVFRPSLLAAAAVLVGELTGTTKGELDTLFSGPTPFLTGTGTQAFSVIGQTIAEAIAPAGDMTPETGLKNLSRLFTLHLGTSLQAWMVDVMADALSLGKLRSFAQFHAAIDAGLGFRRLGMLMWRGPIQQAITVPITRYYQEQYRFSIPGAAEAVDGWYRKVYSDEQMLGLLASAGYSYDRSMELVNIKQRIFTEVEGEELWRRGMVDDAGLVQILETTGMGTDRAALWGTMVQGRRTYQELTAMATTARTLYRAGDMSEDEYKGILSEAHWRDDEIAVALLADQLALRNEKALTVAQLSSAFREGIYTGDIYRAKLRNMRYTDETIDVLMALETKGLTAAQVLEAFTRGQMTRADATARLEKFGYTLADAAQLLDLRAKTLSQGQVLDALGKNLITADVARGDLQNLGYGPDVVDVLLAFMRKTLSPADIQAAVLRGLMDPTQAVSRLMAAGYTQEDAQLIVDLRVKVLTVAQITAAYVDGLIQRAEALGDFQARGLSPADALLVVELIETKLQGAAAKAAAKAPPPPPPPIPPIPPAP